MARSHTRSSRVLVNSTHVSGDIKGWRFEHRRSYGEVTNLLSAGEQFIPGLLAGGIGLLGNFNGGAGNLTEVFDTAAATEGGILTTIAPEGLTVGTIAFIGEGNVSARSVDSAVKDAVGMSLEATPNDGVDIGVWLHALTARTADGNGTSADNTASSAGGAVGSLHVTAYTGFTSVVIKVQHSPDDAVWADLITYTTVTGTTWQRSTATGTVDRYTRVTWDVTGSGSITFAAALARR